MISAPLITVSVQLKNMEVSVMPALNTWIEIGNGLKLMKSKEEVEDANKDSALRYMPAAQSVPDCV